MIKLKIKNLSNNFLPGYATEYSSGMDLRANIEEPLKILPLQRCIVPTGLFIELTKGYEAQIRPRSGMAIKYGITVLNSPGTIDSDYRGEIKVILINLSEKEYTVNNGDRICQMVIHKYEQIEWEESSDLDITQRGAGGFGHTGKS
ncbi:MAG: dUTP diphosphatase [Cyclobacteriaceae bacterium]